MSLESAIADLVSASTSLVSAVNVTRTTLENTEATAAAQVQPAAASATEAANQATAASNSVTAAKASLTTAMADYAAQKTAKGLPAVQSAADSELADRLHRRDPARHPFRGARPSLVMDFVRRECHRNNAAGNLEPVDLSTFMTFTRASTATYVGPDGLIKEAASNVPRYGYDPVTGEALGLLIEEQRTNVLQYGAQINNSTWTISPSDSAYIVPGATIAPDGTLTASKLCETSSTAQHSAYRASASFAADTTVTGSVFVKAAERSYIMCELVSSVGASGGRVTFDLTSGTVASFINIGSPAGVGTAPTISSVGGGWFKLCVTTTTGSTGNANWRLLCFLAPSAGTTTYAGVAGYGLYLWGAQVEAGAFPTSYIPTPATFTGRASTKTYFDSNGVLQTAASGVAVTDYGYVDGRWVSKGLSLEPQATNLLLQSAALNNFSYWGYGGGGTSTAANKISFSANGDARGIQAVSLAGPSDLTLSAQFSAADVGKKVRLSFWAKGMDGISSSGSSNDITIPQSGKVSFTKFGVTGLTNIAIRNSSLATAQELTLAANTGVQLEVGSYATSYIPTTTAQVTRAADTSTSAQVTRAGDTPTVSNFALGPVSVGTISVTHDRVENIAAGYIFEINTAGLDVSRIVCRTDGATAFKVFNIRTASTDSNVVSSVGSIKSRSTVGMSYAGVSCKTSRDGGGVATLAAIEAYHAHVFTNIKLGWTAGNTSNGYIRQLTYFPRQLSDADLQALTILEN